MRARPDEPLADVCEWSTPACPVGPHRAEVRHHRKGRGKGLDAAEFTADVCDAGHRFAHAHPAMSYLHGWMLKRNGI